MKKVLSLLLAAVLTASFAGASAFADTYSQDNPPPQDSTPLENAPAQDASEDGPAADVLEDDLEEKPEEKNPAFKGGAFLSADVPADLLIGETVNFYVSYQNFIMADGYDLTKLTAVMTGADSASFELLPFYRTQEGLIYFTIGAKAVCALQSFSVTVTDGTNHSLPFVFQTSVTEPPSEPESSENQPDPLQNDGADDIMPIENDASGQTQSLSSSSGPESQNFDSGDQEPQISSSGDQEPPSSEQSEDEPASKDADEDAGEDTDEDSDESSGADGRTESSNEVEPPQMPEIPAPKENPSDIFTVRSVMMLASVPQINVPADPADENKGDVNAVATSGTTWKPQSGIPDLPRNGATIPNTTPLVFVIPEDNFSFIAGSDDVAANITKINGDTATYRDNVKVTDAGTDRTGLFNIEFFAASVTGGRAYAVRLTPANVLGEITLSKDTTFGFSGQSNAYKLPKSLTITSGGGSSKAIGLNGYSLGGSYTWITKNGRFDGDIDYASEGDEFLIHFSPHFFEWDGDTPSTVTLSSIRSKISLKQSGIKNSRVFEKIELGSSKGEAVVRIKFKDVIPRTRELEYAATLYMAVRGSRDTSTEFQINGVLGDEEPEEFYSEDKYIDISDGRVGKAMESMRNVRVDVGNGVTVNVSSIRKNARFYGVAMLGPQTRSDEEMLDEYPDIVEIYTLYTLGLNGAGSTVDIDTFAGYHVYDSDMQYLGQKPKALPFSDKYYLAAKLLDIPDDLDEGEAPEFVDEEYMDFPENENANPATGK